MIKLIVRPIIVNFIVPNRAIVTEEHADQTRPHFTILEHVMMGGQLILPTIGDQMVVTIENDAIKRVR